MKIEYPIRDGFLLAVAFVITLLFVYSLVGIFNGMAHLTWLNGKQAGLDEAWKACNSIFIK